MTVKATQKPHLEIKEQRKMHEVVFILSFYFQFLILTFFWGLQ